MRLGSSYLHYVALTGLLSLGIAAEPASAQKKYDTGTTETEIKIGNIMPYSGPASAYGTIGRAEAAYFRMINEQGGINGRKINFISYDDSYSPPKAVEQTRKLVESDEVFLIFSALGTPSNSAIHKYMNAVNVPQLFVATSATKWNDPKNFPWTMGWAPTYQVEGNIYAKYILKQHAGQKIGVLYQNDDYGKDLLKGLKDGLGREISMIVAEERYDTSEPTVDSQIIKLKASGATILVNITTPKYAAQAIKKVSELQWKPIHILNNVSSSIGAVIRPAGFENSQGILTTAYAKDPTDLQWKDDPAMKEWVAFMDKYYPEGDRSSSFNAFGYQIARTLAQVLKQAGDNLTRENIMRQAAALKNFESGLLLPGIRINTSSADFAPLKQLQMMRLKGESWELFGPVISGEVGG
jgi:branched-chain amino acid transport system substrate-binding protein